MLQVLTGQAPLITSKDKDQLVYLRDIYMRVEEALPHMHTAHVARTREQLIAAANPIVQKLGAGVFPYLIVKMDGRATRLGANAVSREAYARATARRTLGPKGIIPDDHRGFGAHVKGMLGAIADVRAA